MNVPPYYNPSNNRAPGITSAPLARGRNAVLLAHSPVAQAPASNSNNNSNNTNNTYTKPGVNAKDLPKHVLFATSGLGGIIGWCIIHPFCTLGIRMNLSSMQQASASASAGSTKITKIKPFAFQQMIKESGGWLSLYDGLSAGIARQVFYSTARFGLFEILRDKLHDYRGGKTDFLSRVVVGATTGGIAAYISCPAEVAVVRMTNDKSLPVAERRNYKNVFDTASRIVKEEGIRTFWRGSAPLVSRAMVVGIFQVATLDQFKMTFAQSFNQQLNSISNVGCAAMASGLVYSLVTQPLEACKNRMASQKANPLTGQLAYKSIFQTLYKVSSEEGFRSLYRGFLPYYLRCGGHTVCMFISIQLLREFYIASTSSNSGLSSSNSSHSSSNGTPTRAIKKEVIVAPRNSSSSNRRETIQCTSSWDSSSTSPTEK